MRTLLISLLLVSSLTIFSQGKIVHKVEVDSYNVVVVLAIHEGGTGYSKSYFISQELYDFIRIDTTWDTVFFRKWVPGFWMKVIRFWE